MEKPDVQEFRSPAPPNWRKLCEELVEASGNAGRMDGLQSWEALLDRTRTLLAQQEPDITDLDNKENFLASLACSVSFHPRDWGLDHRDAWIFGIVCGWGDALPEVARRHKWSDQTVERLQRLRMAAISASHTPDFPKEGIDERFEGYNDSNPATTCPNHHVLSLLRAYSNVDPQMGTSRVLNECHFKVVADAIVNSFSQSQLKPRSVPSP